MRKIIYLVLAMLCLTNTLVSQEKNEVINAFEADSAVWITIIENQRTGEWKSSKIVLYGDTVINGIKWKKAEWTIDYTGFLRYENEKVYYLPPEKDVKEFVLYDFSGNVGDSILYPTSMLDNRKVLLDSIKTLNVCGIKRNYYYYFIGDYNINIEGIGNIRGPFYEIRAIPTYDDYSMRNLAVCTANGKVIYYDPKYADEKGNITFVANEQIPQLDASVTYSDNQIRVVCEKTFSVSVYNLQGQLILQRDGCQGNTSIPFGSEASGIYVVNVSDGAGSYSQKIVK